MCTAFAHVPIKMIINPANIPSSFTTEETIKASTLLLKGNLASDARDELPAVVPHDELQLPNEHRNSSLKIISPTIISEVTRHIKNHWHEYEPFVAAEWNISDPEEYGNFMISEGVYATELECTVATKLHKMNLSIYREINDRGDIKEVFHNRVNSSYEIARLLFSGRSESGHYDVLFIDQ